MTPSRHVLVQLETQKYKMVTIYEIPNPKKQTPTQM